MTPSQDTPTHATASAADGVVRATDAAAPDTEVPARFGRSAPLAPPPAPVIDDAVDRALTEDLGCGDLTSEAFVPVDRTAAARIVAREEGVVAGLPVTRAVFLRVDPSLRFDARVDDGARIEPGDVLAHVSGDARAILGAERVALNFLQRLSGTATLTARFVRAVASTKARIVDTRKTTPGLRALEKYAVRCGGGANHRFDLGDAVLVKENHLALLDAAGESLTEAVTRARERLPHTAPVQIEVDRLDALDDALAARPDAILLDNMTPDELTRAVRRIDGRPLVEASGGITLDTVRAVAETGVDLISVGALTHSAPALDLALDFEA